MTKVANLIKDYEAFTGILHKHQIPYCLDSGVLLALMREGRVFDFEKDVDLMMWAEDANRIKKIIPELKKMGWTVTLWQYRGLLYQFRIARPHMIPVHIMLFRRAGEWAWCPASRATGNPYTAGVGKWLYSLFSWLRKKLRNRLMITDISKWPWKVRRQVATWWVPVYFFAETIYDDNHRVYIPKEWNKYLTFRYGNWRVPASSWDFWVNDGAINHQYPEQLVNLALYN